VSRRLEVLLHGEVVAELVETPEGSELRLLESYRRRVPRPVLGQRFEDDLERTWRSRKGSTLPDFFANLIPEGKLRQVIEQAAGLEAGDDLALLAFVGRDLPGAVEVRAAEGEEPFQRRRGPAAESTAQTESDALRFSLAGVQLKFSMLLEEDKLTLPARDRGGTWIVKLDSPSYPHLPENEYSILEWARAAGFEVPECRLHQAEDLQGLPRRHVARDSKVLAIRRFDRSDKGRIHQEDFAQAVGLPPGMKYEQITYETMARLVRRFSDEEAAYELLRRLALVIASGNNDAHLKNWSLIYSDRIRARWSPLYDQMATVAWPGPDRALALKLAGVKGFDRIDGEAIVHFAERAELDRSRATAEVGKTLERLRAVWQELGAHLPLPADHARRIRRHWRRVPLLAAAGPLD